MALTLQPLRISNRRIWARPAPRWSTWFTGTLMTANVLIILMEERYGTWATPRFGAVLALNFPWLVLPSAMIWRMRRDHPLPHCLLHMAMHETVNANGGPTATVDNFSMDCQG